MSSSYQVFVLRFGVSGCRGIVSLFEKRRNLVGHCGLSQVFLPKTSFVYVKSVIEVCTILHFDNIII